MIRTSNTGNNRQLHKADSSKKFNSEHVNKNHAEPEDIVKFSDKTVPCSKEEENSKSLSKLAERKKTEKKQEIPEYTVEEIIVETPLTGKEQPVNTEEITEKPDHMTEPNGTDNIKPVTMDNIYPEILSFVKEAQFSFNSMQEACDEFLSIVNINACDQWAGLTIFSKIASINDLDERAIAKKDLADICSSLGPDRFFGKGTIVKDIFMDMTEMDNDEEKQAIRDIALAHVKNSSSPLHGIGYYKFVKSCKNQDQSLKEASDDFLAITNLSGDEFSNEIGSLYRQIASINNPEERGEAKNYAMDIFKKIGRNREREGREIFENTRKISDPVERKNEMEVACNQVNASEEPSTGMSNFRFVKSWQEPGQSLKEISDEFLSLTALSGNSSRYIYSVKMIFQQIVSIKDPLERAMAKEEALTIFKGIGPGRGTEGREIFETIRTTSDPGERKKEIELACAHMKAVHAAKDEVNIGADDFKFVKEHKKTGQTLQEASDRFLKLLSKAGNDSFKARKLFLKSAG